MSILTRIFYANEDTSSAMPQIAIPPELLDQAVKGPTTQPSLDAAMKELRKAVIERALHAAG